MDCLFPWMSRFSCLSYPKEDHRLDIIAKLPLEISSIILRNLDPSSLLSAARVNKKWLRIIRSDIVLRKKIHSYLVQRRAMKFNWKKKMAAPFSLNLVQMNEQKATVRATPVQYRTEERQVLRKKKSSGAAESSRKVSKNRWESVMGKRSTGMRI